MRRSLHFLPRLRQVAPATAERALQTICSATSSPATAEPTDTLTDARAAMLRAWPAANTVVRYAGRGVQLGLQVEWSLMLRPDGAFVEEWRSPQLSSVLGHDGGAASKCWEVDGMGLPKSLDLDDHEHCLMSNWVRSGFWARPEARDRIDVTRCSLDELPRSLDMQHDPESPASSSTSSDSIRDQPGDITVRLKHGEVVGRLRTEEGSWKPSSLQIQIFGKYDTHAFTEWDRNERHWFPKRYVHRTAAGSENFFVVTSCATLDAWPLTAFSLPESQLRPPCTSFDPPGGGPLRGWWTTSGHIVVEPRIDGQSVGYMILDTGASGFVIEKQAADGLGLDRFGSFHCSGMVDNVEISFRRAGDIQLGPLTIQEPLFMEMQLGGLVRGAPGEVVGIVGYDVFRRCVMDVPFTNAQCGGLDIQITDPAMYEAPSELEGFWHSLEFVSSLPLVRACIGANSISHDVRLMIDSGAGGVDLMFNKRATDDLGLLDDIPSSTRLIKGVGGSSTEKQRVKSGLLPWMQISESRFEKLDCLFIGSAGLDLSHYVQGIICGELVARCRAVFDFARNRIALLPGGKSTA